MNNMTKKCTCGGEIKSIKHKAFSFLVGFHTDVDFRCEKCNQWYGHETRPFFDKTKDG